MRTILELYKPVMAAMEQAVSVYDDRELAIIVEFFTRANAARNGAHVSRPRQ
jgi:hypothetical protein